MPTQLFVLSLSPLSPCFQCKIIIYYHTYDTNIPFSLLPSLLSQLPSVSLLLSREAVAQLPLSLFALAMAMALKAFAQS